MHGELATARTNVQIEQSHKDLSVLLQFRDSYSWNVQESFPLDRACPEVLDLAS